MASKTERGTLSAVSVAAQAYSVAINRYFDLSLYFMVVTGFVALAGTGRLDGLSLFSVLIALGIRGYQFAVNRLTTLSVRATSQLTLGYILFYFVDLFFISRAFLTTLVHLVLFILVVKLFSVQRERDNLYLAVIAFMMILSAAVLTIDTFFLGALFIFLLLAAATFMTMEMRRSLRQAQDPANGGAVGSIHLAGEQAAMAHSLSKTAAALVVATFIVAPALFYAMPRWSFGRLTSLAARNVYVAGFSDSVRLGEIGRIQQNDTVVMHVQFSDNTRVPADFLLRGLSLSQFDGRRWYNNIHSVPLEGDETNRLDLSTAQANQAFAGTASPLRSPGDVELEYRVLLEPMGVNYFFFVPRPTSLTGEARRYFLDRYAGAVGYYEAGRQIRGYRATSVIRKLDDIAFTGAEMPPDVNRRYLSHHATDPRIESLSREITRVATTHLARAQAIESHLKTTFGYTLEMESVGPDPIAHFLFTRKQGHCEYFASAMALMLQSIGIPSRVVNGFRGGQFNDISGSYIVRARDAHSWVEAYIAGYGWATFDPTPPATPLPTNEWSRMMLYLDAMREFWAEWVINYDFQRQSSLRESATDRVRDLFDKTRMWVRDQYEEMLASLRKTQHEALREPRRFGVPLAIALVLIVTLLNLRRLLRALRTRMLLRKPARAPQHAAAVWYGRMLARLRKRGLVKSPSQTPQEFVRRLPADAPEIQSRVALFTDHYERARFGNSAADAEKLPELYEELEDALR